MLAPQYYRTYMLNRAQLTLAQKAIQFNKEKPKRTFIRGLTLGAVKG